MRNPTPKRKVGGLLFDGFELLDIFGPLEMFGLLRDHVEIVMLGERTGPVHSNQGPCAVAEFTLQNSPPLDVILIPGGWGTRREVENDQLVAELATICSVTPWVASICTGSALLAKTGLLDGRKATSNKRAFSWVVTQGPAVNWIVEARWVEDGKYFTSSGVSAGMDMSLGLIEKIFGRESSQQVASWAEYEWHEDKTHDPFAKFATSPGKG